MFNLEGLIPKLCQLAQEVGDDEKVLHLRSAGLQALSYMVLFFLYFDFLLTIENTYSLSEVYSFLCWLITN